jgi:hypothetical protein
MFTIDLWANIVQHIDCTNTLLKLRLVNKSILSQIPIGTVIGAPLEAVSVLQNPKISKYEPIQISPNENLEGVLSEDGNRMWSWVYSNPIRLTQYDSSDEFKNGSIYKNIVTLSTLNSKDEYLWIRVADNGLICLLKATLDGTLELSVMHYFPRSDVMFLFMTTEIERSRVIRRSIFEDETDSCLFSRNSLQCFTWNTRTFITLLPINQKDHISLLEVKAFNEGWQTWHIPCGSSIRIGCIRQVQNLIYIIPANAGNVFAMDLNDKNPKPALLHTLPVIPNGVSWFGVLSKIQVAPIASMMEVSGNGENYVVNVAGMKQVFHLTKTTIRPLDKSGKLDISACSLIGNDAAICFMKDSNAYRLYNLKTKDFVREFHFSYNPFFSLMRNNCIWSIDHTMTVYRQHE